MPQISAQSDCRSRLRMIGFPLRRLSARMHPITQASTSQKISSIESEQLTAPKKTSVLENTTGRVRPLLSTATGWRWLARNWIRKASHLAFRGPWQMSQGMCICPWVGGLSSSSMETDTLRQARMCWWVATTGRWPILARSTTRLRVRSAAALVTRMTKTTILTTDREALLIRWLSVIWFQIWMNRSIHSSMTRSLRDRKRMVTSSRISNY